MALARMEGYFDSRSTFLIPSMAIYVVLLKISDPVPRGITNFANRETARKMRALRNSGEAGGSIWRWHILARISTNDQVFISYQSYSLMTNITDFPEILDSVPKPQNH